MDPTAGPVFSLYDTYNGTVVAVALSSVIFLCIFGTVAAFLWRRKPETGLDTLLSFAVLTATGFLAAVIADFIVARGTTVPVETRKDTVMFLFGLVTGITGSFMTQFQREPGKDGPAGRPPQEPEAPVG